MQLASRINNSHTFGRQHFVCTGAVWYLDNFQLRIGEAREPALKSIPHLPNGHLKASSARSALDMVQLLRGEIAS